MILIPFVIAQLITSQDYRKPYRERFYGSVQTVDIKPIVASVEAIPDVQLVEKEFIPPAVQTQATGTNLYQAGQCVWYIKNLRPELPNTWGNAWQWIGRAQADGYETGTVPRIGAVGTRGNHVVLIVAILGDQVKTTEMNQKYIPFLITSRILPSDYFVYIY